MRDVRFSGAAFEQYSAWAKRQPKIFERLQRLINETRRTPFEGTGKPEPLKGDLRGCWSRRIDDEHRLIYEVRDTEIKILSCFGHYE
jgi:toxin YoeB